VGESAAFAAAGTKADEDTVPAHVTFADENPNSIVNCIGHALANARTLRHQVATEMWEVLNRFHLDVQRPARRRRAAAGPEHVALFCRSVVEFSQLYQGVTDSTMPREEGWYFLQAGKFLERAEKTARALDVKYHLLAADARAGAGRDGERLGGASEGVPGDWHQWLAVLRSMSAYEAYHKVYRSAVRPRGVIEFLTLSPIFPRSIRFSINEVAGALAQIAAHQSGNVVTGTLGEAAVRYVPPGAGSEVGRAVGRLRGTLAYQRVEEIFAEGLREYLLDIQRQCFQIGELIEGQYFAHRAMRVEEVLV
jgi:uncharacterized alpha-E superfamily protein